MDRFELASVERGGQRAGGRLRSRAAEAAEGLSEQRDG